MHTSARLILLALALAVAACDQIGGQYEIVRAGDQTFLLHRGTGEAKLIVRDALIPVRPVEADSADAPFKQAKTWPKQTISDLPDVQFAVRTKYRDGSMLWIVEAKPYAGALEKAFKRSGTDLSGQPTVMLELYDSDGFRTGDAVEVKLRAATRTIDTKGDVYGLSWSGRQAMHADTYRAATFLSTSWYGFAKE